MAKKGASVPARANTHQSKLTLYSKSFNHCVAAYQAIGVAIRRAIKTSFRKLADNRVMMLVTDAPITFRIPISLVRCSAVNMASPNNPIQEIKMAMAVAVLTSWAVFCSFSYNWAMESLKNVYSNLVSG